MWNIAVLCFGIDGLELSEEVNTWTSFFGNGLFSLNLVQLSSLEKGNLNFPKNSINLIYLVFHIMYFQENWIITLIINYC